MNLKERLRHIINLYEDEIRFFCQDEELLTRKNDLTFIDDMIRDKIDFSFTKIIFCKTSEFLKILSKDTKELDIVGKESVDHKFRVIRGYDLLVIGGDHYEYDRILAFMSFYKSSIYRSNLGIFLLNE